MTFDEWFLSKQGEPYDSMYVFARDAWIAAQEVEREACAKVCEEQRDLREEARATLRASDALKSGDEDAMLHALRHESNVRLYHAGIDKCAVAIRARGTNGQ